jgi:hypothetical protein
MPLHLAHDLERRYADGGAPADGYAPARDVRQRYRVSDMTIFRWLADDKMSFPRPYYFGRFRYWKISELEGFERDRPRTRRPVA